MSLVERLQICNSAESFTSFQIKFRHIINAGLCLLRGYFRKAELWGIFPINN